jgi:hypothetical protein
MATVIITSKIDFLTFTWTPPEAVDLDTEPGSVLMVAGQTQLDGYSPTLVMQDWVRWTHLEADGVEEEAAAYLLRFRCGDSELECQEADWSPYLDSVLADGKFRYNIGALALNDGRFNHGPYFEIHARLLTD